MRVVGECLAQSRAFSAGLKDEDRPVRFHLALRVLGVGEGGETGPVAVMPASTCAAEPDTTTRVGMPLSRMRSARRRSLELQCCLCGAARPPPLRTMEEARARAELRPYVARQWRASLGDASQNTEARSWSRAEGPWPAVNSQEALGVYQGGPRRSPRTTGPQ